MSALPDAVGSQAEKRPQRVRAKPRVGRAERIAMLRRGRRAAAPTLRCDVPSRAVFHPRPEGGPQAEGGHDTREAALIPGRGGASSRTALFFGPGRAPLPTIFHWSGRP